MLSAPWYPPAERGSWQYLTLIRPERGEISFLKEFPIWAAAKGNLPWLNSSRRLKLRNIPCAVSGLRYLKGHGREEKSGRFKDGESKEKVTVAAKLTGESFSLETFNSRQKKKN